MRLLDASCHEYALTIEDEEIIAQKLSLGDLEGISQALAQEQREAAPDQEARNAVEPQTPGQLLPWLLVTARGQALTLWTAIHHRHPDMTMARIMGLAWTDELVQVVYDLLEVKRGAKAGVVAGDEQRPDPPRSGPTGEPTSPTALTSTPASTGEDLPTEK